jgi:hypothetical protein
MQVVEISRGSKVKYELDKATGLIKVIIHTISSSHSNLYRLLIYTSTNFHYTQADCVIFQLVFCCAQVAIDILSVIVKFTRA